MASTSSLYASNEAVIMERVFASSTTWSPPFNCRAYVTVIGPGGSGASARNSANNQSQAASGGGAGGCAKSLLVLSSSVTYTITVGAGGASVSGAAGNDGGANSVFSGSDITDMTANLGNGGAQAVANGAVSVQAGGTGGAASGGNIWNVTGGAGGSATISAPVSSSGADWASGGGGAAGVLGTAHRGGNALLSTAGYWRMAMAGGAGLGGRGGDATVTGGTSGSGSQWPLSIAGGGGGSEDGPDASNDFSGGKIKDINGTVSAGTNLLDYENYNSNDAWVNTTTTVGTAWIGSADDTTHSNTSFSTSIFHGLNGVCSRRTVVQTRGSGPGAGGSGNWGSGAANYYYMVGGLFGGGGGACVNYYDSQYSSQNGYGGAGSFGAGGGAITSYAASSNVTQSGAGGSGLVVVTILDIL